MGKIEQIRKGIDRLDGQILQQLLKRATLAKKNRAGEK